MGVRFVRLAITGFKSFADPAAIAILPGLTGIVGPNGCGKSNVSEALRWVMGEANARRLRGGEMDDVIFAGAANRPSRNLAEVSLHMEADDGGLPHPFAGHADLQVTRRIERGGGSAYRVNGQEARARDVQTLFADLASGARSAAMISQGRVSALVSARPEERRAVLEEAAGISGLHARRAEAESRLHAAEANLERADERQALLEQQLAGLRQQAKQAARYRAVVESLGETEAALLALQQARAEAARNQSTEALRQANDAARTAAKAAGEAAREAKAAEAALPRLRAAEADARTHGEQARLHLEKAAAEQARLEAALAATTQRQADLARDAAHARSVLQDADGADARLADEAEQLRSEAEAHPALLNAAAAEVAASAAALQAADAAAAEAAARAAEAGAKAAASRHVLNEAEARARRAQDAHSRLQAEHGQAQAQLIDPAQRAAVEAQQREADQTAKDARAGQEGAEQTRRQAAQTATKAREAHAQADAARQKLAAETAALSEVLAVTDDERWRPMIDRLNVAAGLESALAAALGEELAAAGNADAARYWRDLPALPAPPLPGRRMADLVEAPAPLARALSVIGLVQSDDEGDAAQADLQPGQCLVSAAGAVWRWDGYVVRAGTPTAAAVRLQQRNRLKGLRLRLADTEQAAQSARTKRGESEQAERDAIAAERQSVAARSSAEQAAEQGRANARTLAARAEAAATKAAALESQLAPLLPELEAARSALAAARQEHAAQADPARLKAQADEARGVMLAARARDVAAARNLDALQRAGQARQSRLGTIARERADRRSRAHDLSSRVTDLSARAAETDALLARLSAEAAAAARQTGQAREAVAISDPAHQHAATAAAKADRKAAALAAAAHTAEQAGYAAREAVIRAEGAQDAAQQAWSAIQARLAERAGALPPLPQAADLSPAHEDRLATCLQRLARERDQIGPVNLRAEIESQALESDLATIANERGELAAAIAKLRGNIGNQNREGRERLSAVFHAVDNHFQALFSRMFGGGRAHLALVGSDDPLQAGLEIYAQPPGKKLAALSLLSGGEQALTALSLVFAVFRCNPAPLCVLDEVDAALDDANVDRFCALLSDMARDGARFLVVTHHQLTMARMDRLYGVTMQERGVSRLLSVDLSAGLGMIEAVAAE